MAEASASTWRPDDLQGWASEAIAGATGAEAGWVTAGAAAGLTLGAAACIAGHRLDVMDALPDTGSVSAEVIVQRGHRNAYDRAFRTAGARIVEVGYPLMEGVGLTYEWQLEAAFSEQTVAVAHFAVAETEGVPLPRVCELAAPSRCAGDRRCRGRASPRVEPAPVPRRGGRARRVQRRQGDPRASGLGHPRGQARPRRVGSAADARHGHRRRDLDRARGNGASAPRPRAEHEAREGADRGPRRGAGGVPGARSRAGRPTSTAPGSSRSPSDSSPCPPRSPTTSTSTRGSSSRSTPSAPARARSAWPTRGLRSSSPTRRLPAASS